MQASILVSSWALQATTTIHQLRITVIETTTDTPTIITTGMIATGTINIKGSVPVHRMPTGEQELHENARSNHKLMSFRRQSKEKTLCFT